MDRHALLLLLLQQLLFADPLLEQLTFRILRGGAPGADKASRTGGGPRRARFPRRGGLLEEHIRRRRGGAQSTPPNRPQTYPRKHSTYDQINPPYLKKVTGTHYWFGGGCCLPRGPSTPEIPDIGDPPWPSGLALPWESPERRSVRPPRNPPAAPVRP